MRISPFQTTFLLACMSCAQAAPAPAPTPNPTLKPRTPQEGDRPGLWPEVTSLFASLYGDGEDAIISAIYGNDEASSALDAATSAAGAGDTGAAESYWSEATAAVGTNWADATDAAADKWTSYTSQYDAVQSVQSSLGQEGSGIVGAGATPSAPAAPSETGFASPSLSIPTGLLALAVSAFVACSF